MQEKDLRHAMDLAEKLCTKIYDALSEEEKNDEALIVALIWTAIAIGLKSEVEAPILRVVVQYATDSALEDYLDDDETLH
tara:strand:+ start:212 stop:451 length:240 start_codon:yes stop_codon:yes gene_type:complete